MSGIMSLTNLKVLSFGCYGTLIDRDSGIWTALRPLLASSRIGLPRQEVLAAFDRHEFSLGARNPELPYSEMLAQAHRALAKEWGTLCSDAGSAGNPCKHLRQRHRVTPNMASTCDRPESAQ